MLLFLLVLMFLSACSGQETGQLTRVDVQKVNEEGSYEDVSMVTDQEKIDILEEYLTNVNWEPNTEAEMARKEDLKTTLFYTFDKNMPERLYEHRIWFEGNEAATIISNKENEGYGKLDKEYAQGLKKILIN